MQYYIRDWKLLLKCGGVLLVVLAFFFMYSFVPNVYVGIGGYFSIPVPIPLTLSRLLFTAKHDSMLQMSYWRDGYNKDIHVCLLCFCLMLVWMSYSFKNCCYTTNLILAVPGAAFVPLLLTYHSLEATIKHDLTINKKWTIYFLLFINLSAYCPKSSGWFYFPTTCVPCLPRALVKYISVILSLSSYFLMPSLSLTLRWFKAI